MMNMTEESRRIRDDDDNKNADDGDFIINIVVK